jgi:glycyl-tRNA synthetase
MDGNKKYIPYVIETSVGCDRHVLALLCDAYKTEKVEGEEERLVLALKPELAPIKIAILPLMKKDGIEELALKIESSLSKQYKCDFDASGSIGKRYRRQDEVGTPYCLTVDYDSLEKNTVTIRHRDTMKQDQVNLSQLMEYFSQKNLT